VLLAYPFVLPRAERRYDGAYHGFTTEDNRGSDHGIDARNTITLDIAANNGGISHGAWTAWTRVMEVGSPYTVVGGEYCATQSWRFSVAPS